MNDIDSQDLIALLVLSIMIPSIQNILVSLLLDPGTLVMDRIAPREVILSQLEISIADSTSRSIMASSTPPSMISSITLASTANDQNRINSPFRSDTVVRVTTDPNTIKLEKSGLVKLWGVETPTRSTAALPFSDCLDKSPSYKIRKLLPPGTKVQVQIIGRGGASSSSSSPSTLPTAVVIRATDGQFVSQELVRAGFARVKSKNPTSVSYPPSKATLTLADLQQLEKEARDQQKGLFKQCSSDDGTASSTITEAIFEPLEWTTETQWGDNGGKTVRRKRDEPTPIPSNPGDKVGCSDFDTYEAALQYYEKYFYYYGDVAKLDRRQLGVP